METLALPVACTIAGSDSGGGAGIQADLRSFAACGVHGATVVTAITAQDTTAVHAVDPVSLEMIVRQIDAVAIDMHPRAWKTGMLSTAEIVAVVAQRLEMHGVEQLVVDPVMRATTGAALASNAALEALRGALLPLALVVTPNAPEAAALSGLPVGTAQQAEAAAKAIAALGPRLVVITGGHHGDDPSTVTDLAYHAPSDAFATFTHPRVAGEWHGTGCTFSAAVAAFLARGADPLDAAACASEFVATALQRGRAQIGAGAAPLLHVDPQAAAPLLHMPTPAQA